MADLVISSVLWDANETSMVSSRCYSEVWVERLYRGFARNLTVPFEFVLFTDRIRKFKEPISQQTFRDGRSPDYGSCVEPFVLNRPMIFLGLDSVVVGSCDKFARWCLQHPGKLALPRHPYESWSINGVVLWGGGNPAIFDNWAGENDMDWMRLWPHARIDDLWRDRIVSYKARVAKQRGLPPKCSIVYFHGVPKMHDLPNEPFIRAHWR